MRYNSRMTQTTPHAKIYLSTPALICGAADNADAFVHALCAGDQHGIQRVSSGLPATADAGASDEAAPAQASSASGAANAATANKALDGGMTRADASATATVLAAADSALHAAARGASDGASAHSAASPDTAASAANAAPAADAAPSAASAVPTTDAAAAAKQFYAGRIADERLLPTGDRHDMRVLRILEAALRQLDGTVARAKERYGKAQIGVCVGSCDNGSELSLAAHRAYFDGGAFPHGYALGVQGADYPARYAAERFGVTGVALTFATACSSSASAIIKARELILAGVCDAVVAGGVDVASPTVLLGFDSLEAVSSTITNPFSRNRHGITLGEGAAFFVLSRDDLDGTGITLAGAGESADASHMTAPLADGSGAKAAMEAALRDAGIAASDIGYVNLHGTGTRLNDSMEGKAVAAVFGGIDGTPYTGAGANGCPSCPVPASSTKPLTGHTLGAAGALELAACFLASKHQILPVHRWDGERDPDIPPLNFVNKSDCPRPLRYCMSNSFAFGGANASLILHNERS